MSMCIAPPRASDEIFTCRLSTYSSVVAGSTNYDGVRVDCIASGYTGYDQLVIKCRKGRVHIMGLGFTVEQDRPVQKFDWTHQDNVVGLSASLAAKADASTVYSRSHIDAELGLKANQADLLSVYDGSSFA